MYECFDFTVVFYFSNEQKLLYKLAVLSIHCVRSNSTASSPGRGAHGTGQRVLA